MSKDIGKSIWYETLLLKRKIIRRKARAEKKIVKELTGEMKKTYKKSMSIFYNDKVFFNGRHKPVFYDRTGSLKEGMSVQKIDMLVGYGEHMLFSGDNIDGNPYRADEDWVYNRAYDNGIHGIDPNSYREKARIRPEYVPKRTKASKTANAMLKRKDREIWKVRKISKRFQELMEI